MEKRICTKCNQEKNLDLFYKNKRHPTGRGTWCQVCYTEDNRIRRQQNKEKYNQTSKNWILNNPQKHELIRLRGYKKNREKILIYAKIYREKNKEKLIEQNRKYKKENYEKCRQKSKEWHSKNREKINKNKRDRKKRDYLYKFKSSISSRTKSAFDKKKWHKNGPTERIMGCSYEIAKSHIERQFKKGMAWENHGEWHIDHIIPLASAKNVEELVVLLHYTNLQPLWKIENMKKSAKIIKPIQTKIPI